MNLFLSGEFLLLYQSDRGGGELSGGSQGNVVRWASWGPFTALKPECEGNESTRFAHNHLMCTSNATTTEPDTPKFRALFLIRSMRFSTKR